MLGKFTSALLDPFSYLLLALPLRKGHIPYDYIQAYFAILHCFAGLAAYILARELKVRRAAAVIAGLFYAIAGIPGASIWIQFVTETIYPPLAFTFLIRSLRGRKVLANAALAGLLVGMSWFSGTHHIPLVSSICFAIILLVFMFLGNWRQGLLRLVVFGGMVVCISAPQTLPTLQYSQYSTRWVGLNEPVSGGGKVPFQAHVKAENLRPSELLGILFPVDFGFWGSGIIFAGIIATLLALYALRRFSTSKIIRLCVALVGAGILMGLSQHNIFYGIFYLFVPVFDKLRESSVWIYVTHLGLTCLVALGVEFFFRDPESLLFDRARKFLVALGLTLLTVGYVARFWAVPAHEAEIDRLALSGLIACLLAIVLYLRDRQLIRPILASALLVALLMIEHGGVSSLGGRIYFPRGPGWTSRYEQPLRNTDAIADFLRTRNDLQRIDVNRSDVPMNFGDYQRIEEMSSHEASMLTSIFQIRFWEPHARQLFGVNYYVARQPSQPGQSDIFTAPDGIKVFKNSNAQPRVWTVHRIIPVSSYSEARQVLSNPAFDVSNTAFLNESTPQLQPCASPDRLELVKRDWFTVVIRATMACQGMVVLNDNWYPGWRARLDGAATRIYPAYMTIRGLVVPAGSHTIEMHYRPRSFYVGLLLFLGGCVATVVLFRQNENPGSNLLD